MSRQHVKYMCWQQAAEPSKEEDLIILDGNQIHSQNLKDKVSFSIAQDIMASIANLQKSPPIGLEAIPGSSMRIAGNIVLLELPSTSDDVLGRERPILFWHVLPARALSSEAMADISTHIHNALQAAAAIHINNDLISQITKEIFENIKKKKTWFLLIIILGIILILGTIIAILALHGYPCARYLILFGVGSLVVLLMLMLSPTKKNFPQQAPLDKSQYKEKES